MNTLEELQRARQALRLLQPTLCEQDRERMLPLFLNAAAHIAGGLPRDLALKAVLAAYDDAAPAKGAA